MRASRLLTILSALQVHGRVTASALAEQLEVSKRTIYRDMDELSAAGIPVYAERGAEGGFRLLDAYRTELTGLTGEETDALLLAGLPAAAADLGMARAAGAARLKLLAALPLAAREDARRVADRFHLDPVDWYRRSVAAPHLATVAAAVWRECRLRIAYESWRSRGEQLVDPLGLILKAGTWYLAARTGRKVRIYRLSNVHSAEMIESGFERPPDFDLSRFWAEEVDRFESSLRRQRARIRMAESALSRLDRLPADMASPLAEASPDAGGWREAEVWIEGTDNAASLLLAFADAVEVVEPAALREAIAERAARTLALYREADSREG